MDCVAKMWIDTHKDLAFKRKSELITKLKYELCLAKNIEYDPRNDSFENEKDNNKNFKFDTKRIFLLFMVINDLMNKSERKNFIEFVCKKGNALLLRMVSNEEEKGAGRHVQYPWKGHFTGYTKNVELLLYVIGIRCSPEIVLCLAEKLYGRKHNIYCGTQYIEDSVLSWIETRFNQPNSVVRECLKKAIQFGYKDAVLVALGGDIYQCIQLMKTKMFEDNENCVFLEAYQAIKEVVANLLSSWIEKQEMRQSFKDDAQLLLDQGIKLDVSHVDEKDLVNELESLGIHIETKRNIGKKILMMRLGEETGESDTVKLKLRKTVVGALISVLFFKHPDVIMKAAEGKEQSNFKSRTSEVVEYNKQKELEELNEDINMGKPVKDIISGYIKLLNSSNHMNHGWFFKEVLTKFVNERFCKLKSVCTAICKGPIEELIRGETVPDEIISVLKFVGVEQEILERETSDAGLNRSVHSDSQSDAENFSQAVLANSSLRSDNASPANAERQSPAHAASESLDVNEQTSSLYPNEPQKTNTAEPVNPQSKRSNSINKTPITCDEKARTQQQPHIIQYVPLSPPKISDFGSNFCDSKKANGGTENNEDIEQNNCGQDQTNECNITYRPNWDNNKGEYISGGLRKPSEIEFKVLDEKQRERCATLRMLRFSSTVGRQRAVHPPSIQELSDARRNMYMEEALNEFILNYDTLSFDGLYQRSLLGQSLEENFDNEVQELYELFGNHTNFTRYEKAIFHLKNNKVSTANRLLFGLVNEAVQPAYYVYALAFFKDLLSQCDVLNPSDENVSVMEKYKDDIIAVVQLLKRATLMEPASSFLSGMMKRYDIGRCSQILGEVWEDDLVHVVNVASTYGFFDVDHDILNKINFSNRWDSEKCGIGVKRKANFLRQMGRYSLYEIALSMSSEHPFNINGEKELLMILSNEFPEAIYGYGVALLQLKFGSTLKQNTKEAMEYLNRAIAAGHEGAMFILGMLPFYNEIARTLTRREINHCIRTLTEYIISKKSSCILNEKNRNKAACCLAAEYYANESYLVLYNKQKVD